ncbi:MAG TPA: VOC family protein [Candidatus Baltobacteraceae bacterium]|nr:VOC family protein [Candidatus Baltobacteraceae bacterium]
MYIAIVTIFVDDQDRAKKFYLEQLGWELVDDEPMGEMGRWLTVKPPGAQTAVTLTKGLGERQPEKTGGNSGIALECDDVFAVTESLKKKGVKFTTEPSIEFFGGWAMFQDSEGNVIGLHSPAPVGAATQ